MSQCHISTDEKFPLTFTVVLSVTEQREQDFISKRYNHLAVGTTFGRPVFGCLQMLGQSGVLTTLITPIGTFQLVEITGYTALFVGE